ncbi:acyl carrier protein [Paenibacillus sp. FSL M7-0420]|uniref:acyl carrier protein n=1 Tax=Paenibacillus sp. FSL M7-0420 TaxID=2921609 RepID=UPI0030FA7E2F
MTTTKTEVEAKVKEIVASIADFELEATAIDSGKDGLKKLGLNSLALIRIMVEIEKEYEIEMNIDEENDYIMNSVCDLAEYILSWESDNLGL